MGGTLNFGEHVLDPRTRILRRRGKSVNLQSQPLEILMLLVEQADRLVTREDIRARVWQDIVVDYDQSINYAIRHIRAALGPDGCLIQTVPRRGYRFTGPVYVRPQENERPPKRVLMAAALMSAFASVFAAGLLSRHTVVGTFIYDHLVHPDHCPYMRMLVPTRNS